MVNLNLQTILVALLQEIPGCHSIFLMENANGRVVARAAQNLNIATNEPPLMFFNLKQYVQEALQTNGDEVFHEIVISGKKQINLMLMLHQEKYLLWISTEISTKLGVIRYKLAKFLNDIEKIL